MPDENQIQKIKKPKNTGMILLYSFLALAVIIVGVVIYFRYFKSEAGESLIEKITKPITKENKVANGLDGTLVDESLANRTPLAVMVENHPESRPHAGLTSASVVYEAITEGGITRFMALYGPQNVSKVGPVRSARTYFIDWLAEYNAFYAHVGGNLDALEKIVTDKVKDLDQFGLGTTAYWREPVPGVAIEHTMFTSIEKLYSAAKNKKWSLEADFKPLKFKKEASIDERPESQEITVDFSSDSYKVKWVYDKQTNKYDRFMAGLAHKDRTTGDQIAASNIIVQSVERWEAPTAINEQGWAMQTVGQGKALVFQNGKEIEATWKKTSRTARTVFYDEDGSEIKLIPGQIWYEIVPPDVFSAKVSVK